MANPVTGEAPAAHAGGIGGIAPGRLAQGCGKCGAQIDRTPVAHRTFGGEAEESQHRHRPDESRHMPGLSVHLRRGRLCRGDARPDNQEQEPAARHRWRLPGPAPAGSGTAHCPGPRSPSPPMLHMPWIDDMTGRPIRASVSAAKAFIATSIMPPEAPNRNRAAAKGADPLSSTSPSSDSRNRTKLTAINRALPTSWISLPLAAMAEIAPRPMNSRSRPKPASSTPRRALASGTCVAQAPYIAPLMKKAVAAGSQRARRRGWVAFTLLDGTVSTSRCQPKSCSAAPKASETRTARSASPSADHCRRSAR